MHSYFKNTESKKEIIDLYFQKLQSLKIDYEFLTVETSYGNSNIIITGHSNNPPLVLVHGENSCAPMALESLTGLENKFRIYAIDVLGQPNLSDEVRLDKKSDDYGKWMYEIISRLTIYNFYLVGISFGGFISLKFLAYDDTRISKAFLIKPTGIIKVNILKQLTNIMLPLKTYLFRKNKRCLKKYLKHIEVSEKSTRSKYLMKLLLNYRMNYATAPLISAREAQNITTPLSFISGKNDLVYPGIKLLKRAKAIFPSLIQVVLLENATHVTNKEAIIQIKELILESLF